MSHRNFVIKYIKDYMWQKAVNLISNKEQLQVFIQDLEIDKNVHSWRRMST